MKMKTNNVVPILMISVSIIGFSLFFLLPFAYSIVFALTDNPIQFNFVGLQNFKDLFNNDLFLLGLRNTFKFMIISIPLNIVLSLIIALIILKINIYINFFTLVFLIPLVIPSATTALFWESLFSLNGVVNKYLTTFGYQQIDWFNSEYGMYIMILIFLWKNIGYNMVLFISGLTNIPESYYEAAQIEGASRLQVFTKITLVYLIPTSFLVLIMTFVNSFGIFREIYIITGRIPHESLYVLQHFMNNMFFSLNYSRLASASYVITIIIVLFVGFVFKAENKITKDLI